MKRQISLPLIYLAVIALIFVILVRSRTETFIDVSPNGTYRIEHHWLDLGGAGYRVEGCLIEQGFPETKYPLYDAPFGCKWLSDDTFEFFDGTGKQIFHVDDIIRR